MLSGFENDEATFYVEREVATESDAYGDDETVYDWVPLSLDESEWDYIDGEVVYNEANVESVQVRSEQRDADYVRDVYGEWPMEVYRLYVDPFDIGGEVRKKLSSPLSTYSTQYSFAYGGLSKDVFELFVSADDRVELASSNGRFTAQAPKLQRMDAEIPEFIQLEITRVEV